MPFASDETRPGEGGGRRPGGLAIAILIAAVKSGPSARTEAEKATFRFKSNEAGSSFQCKLDRKPWSGCRSPKTYRNLKPGKHTFKVRARDGAGNTDPSPAKRSWRVLPHD